MSNYTLYINNCQGISNKMSTNINFLTIRKELALNQTQFAAKLSTSQNLISKYEKGDVEVPYKIINNLHKILNININWLLTGKGEMFIKDLNSVDKVADPKQPYSQTNKLTIPDQIDFNLSQKEIEILKSYRDLDKDYQIEFYGQIISAAAKERRKAKENNLLLEKDVKSAG